MQKHSVILELIFVLLLAGALVALVHQSAVAPAPTPISSISTSTQPSAAASALPQITLVSSVATSTVATTTRKTAVVPLAKHKQPNMAQQSQNTTASTSENIASRIENPYPTPPLNFTDINTATRDALVNIFCTPHGGSLHPISGSGVLIDPRGVILTNAHVAQYVLLSESPQVNLGCVVRTGSPANAHYVPRVLYMPAVWVSQHASEVNSEHPLGTGEHDYALLMIASTTDDSPLPQDFPAVSPDIREAIAFVDDPVLTASYPAELAAGSVQMSLYQASSVTTIDRLFTFGSGNVDVISVGGVIEAQSGSSGGAIVNAWGRLVGVITTTSDGTTTAQRDLRGITTSYIDRDLATQTGSGLPAMLSGDLREKTEDFTKNQAVALLNEFAAYVGN